MDRTADDAVPHDAAVVEATMQPRHRVSAIGALTLYAAAVVSFAVGIVRGFPLVFVPFLAVALAAYFGWKALAHRQIRRVGFALLCGLCVFGAIGGAVWLTAQLPVLLLGAGLAAVGSVLSGAALAWMHQPRARLVGRTRHPVLIVNPRSGDGACDRAGVTTAARRRRIKVVELGEGDDLAELAERAVQRGADCLGMAGGDGSLALVAGIAMDADIPFVCLPGGTRNHFALDLGLDRSDLIGALDGFGRSIERRVDIGRVNGRLFVNNVSVGAYGEVVANEDYRDRKVGTALEAIPDLIGPDAEPLDLQFVDGAGQEHDSAVVIHVSNNAYDIGPMLGLAGRPSLDDGELGVVAVLQENEAGSPRVLQWQAPQFEIRSGAAIHAGVDGEAVELEPPVRFDLEPAALRVRMPKAAHGLSPAAKRPPLTTRTVRRLLSVARGVAPSEDLTGSSSSSVA